MKNIPFNEQQIQEFIKKNPTPFYIYDEKGIRESARKLIDSFSWCPGFKEYFAVKATPNPAILNILKAEGCGADCSSLPELILAEQAGIAKEDIMFTSNDTPVEEFKKAKELGAIINLDDIGLIDPLEQGVGLPDLVCFRYNPGTSGGNSIIGTPQEAKFGVTREQLFEGFRIAKEKGITRFGLHTMVASNDLNPQHFIDTAKMLFDLALEIKNQLGIQLEFVNLGGGLGIPYLPEAKEIDLELISKGIKAIYDSYNLQPLKIFMECGRYITGPHGYLVTSVLHLKNTYKNYVGVDATMANLMRPGMYGAYHHISILGKETQPENHVYDVVGSLCENNDKFAINRNLPEVTEGDIVVIHDAGAHGHAMGFNYNGKLRSAEFLLQANGDLKMIRRAETIDDYFSTLKF